MNESEIDTPEVREDARTVAVTDPATPSTSSGDGTPVGKEAVLDALRNVVDPELGINIVDLGLVYEVAIAEDGDVDIQYTLTTMGCPIGPMIEDQMRAFLAPLDGIGEVRPEMVIRPAWTPEMMSEEAKAALGMF
jgi:metal-sulfur cluster biosynthetic enzyme